MVGRIRVKGAVIGQIGNFMCLIHAGVWALTVLNGVMKSYPTRYARESIGNPHAKCMCRTSTTATRPPYHYAGREAILELRGDLITIQMGGNTTNF